MRGFVSIFVDGFGQVIMAIVKIKVHGEERVNLKRTRSGDSSFPQAGRLEQ